MNVEFYCDPAYNGCGALPNEPCNKDCKKATAAREEILSGLTEPHAKTPPLQYSAALFRFPTHDDAVRVPLMYAATLIEAHFLNTGISSSHILVPTLGDSHAYYRMNINYSRNDVMPGWLHLRLSLFINQSKAGDTSQDYPINIYDAEPTDIYTGLVRFPPMPVWNHRSKPDQVSDGIVWMLGMRRSL